MSKICENCGNMIPDGKDTCPACGRVEYNDEALQAALEEMMRNLGSEEPAASAESAERPETPETHTEAMGDTMMFDKEQIRKASAEDQKKRKPQSGAGERREQKTAAKLPVNEEEPEAAESPAVERPAMTLPTEEEPEQRERPANPQPRKKKPAGSGNRSGKNTGKSSGKNSGKSSGNRSGKNKKKKRKKKKKGSNVVTVIIVVLILLLLALGGACIAALNAMGFFDTETGEELLLPPASEMEATVSEVPVEEPPVVSEEPVEETPASALEEDADDGTFIPEIEGMETPADSEDLTVTKFNVTGASDVTLNARGETSQVVYVIQPEEAKANIQWESSDTSVASVDASGVILGRRGGYCTITGTCGEMSVTINVTCNFTVPSTVLDMNYLDITMSYEGQTADLYIDYDLNEEQIKSTVWESSDPSVATVDTNGTVTAVANGTAVISASIGQYTASCIVRCVDVTGNRGYNNSTSEYAINYEDVTLTRKGEYFQLSLKSVLTNETPTVTWKSSDTKVATVDSKGVVTALANGTAEITTTIGEDQFRCIVRVNISG